MKRRLIYCPEINHSSVVLLFEKGDKGESWSVRDYSRPGSVILRYAREFDSSLSELSDRILHSLDAPAVSTNDVEFWHQLTLKSNASLNLLKADDAEQYSTGEPATEVIEQPTAQFGLIDHERLLSLQKARKAEDMRRILHSPNSEDWVTWNVFAMVQKHAPETWWEHLIDLARHDNPKLTLPHGSAQIPKVSLWRSVPAPREYETSSRARLRASAIAEWIDRAEKPGPVEGDSEIDISIHNDAVTVFIEAKLGSDISSRTTYDPDRNQIVRNIDCLLDDARGTVPLFWMLVRDSGQGRAYTQLMHTYRRDPAKLVEALPHRNPTTLQGIAQRLSIVLWLDFVQALPTPFIGDGTMLAIYRELHIRIQSRHQ
jgi:hypothetical protein